MKRAVAWLPCLLLAVALTSCAVDPEIPTLNVPDLPKQDKVKSLLVLVFDYDNGFYDKPDAEVERQWSDLVFGTGSIEQETASINDYFIEISGGVFQYQPIFLGENTTGVYSIHLNKNYSSKLGLHRNWPFQDYAYDMTTALKPLVDIGLELDDFKVEGLDNVSYKDVMGNQWDGSMASDDPSWHATSTILAVYPGSGTENTEFFPLTTTIDSFSLVAAVNHNSSFGVIARELTHTLGAQSTCNTGFTSSSLTTDLTQEIAGPYNTVHIEPFYKILYGWTQPTVFNNSGNVTLYPATSSKYRPAVIRTSDASQYYIVENRQAEKFDQGLGPLVGDGLKVWRVDRLGCLSSDESSRDGITLETTMRTLDPFEVRSYVNTADATDISETLGGVVISIVEQKPDGSIAAKITYRH